MPQEGLIMPQKNSRDNKHKMQEFINACQNELKKTTRLGIKMLSASRANTELHESYEILGRITARAIRAGELEWRDGRVKILLNDIKELEEILERCEEEVVEIKNKKLH